MHLIVGLGNPGPDYSRTRHNVGFMAIDEIISCYGLTHCKVKKRPHGEFTNGQVGSNKLILLKPLSFMNESGKPVGEAMRYFGLDTTQIVVFHDEIDLVLGKIRVKSGGGHAGHNGIRDIEKHVGNEFHRVRLGVGRPHSRFSLRLVGDDTHFVRREGIVTSPPFPGVTLKHGDRLAGDEFPILRS